MADIATLMKEIEGLKANQQAMEIRLRELEAVGHAGTAPTINEATDEDLIYILRVHGEEAHRKALKERNRQRAKRWGMDKRLKEAA